MGIRSVGLTLSDGDELVIPFSRVTSDILWLKAAGSAVFPHSFVMGVVDPDRTSALFDSLRRAVLLHHGAACSRPPEVRVIPTGLEVTVFTLDERRGPEVERSIRRMLEQPPPPSPEQDPPRPESTDRPTTAD